jgi:hypothetical protein
MILQSSKEGYVSSKSPVAPPLSPQPLNKWILVNQFEKHCPTQLPRDRSTFTKLLPRIKQQLPSANLLTLTWDLDQKMKTSATMRKRSSASGSGSFSHLALNHTTSKAVFQPFLNVNLKTKSPFLPRVKFADQRTHNVFSVQRDILNHGKA